MKTWDDVVTWGLKHDLWLCYPNGMSGWSMRNDDGFQMYEDGNIFVECGPDMHYLNVSAKSYDSLIRLASVILKDAELKDCVTWAKCSEEDFVTMAQKMSAFNKRQARKKK